MASGHYAVEISKHGSASPLRQKIEYLNHFLNYLPNYFTGKSNTPSVIFLNALLSGRFVSLPLNVPFTRVAVTLVTTIVNG